MLTKQNVQLSFKLWNVHNIPVLVHNLQTVQSIWEISGKRNTEVYTNLNNSHDDNDGYNGNVANETLHCLLAIRASNHTNSMTDIIDRIKSNINSNSSQHADEHLNSVPVFSFTFSFTFTRLLIFAEKF